MALTNGPNLGLLVNGNLGESHYSELMAAWRGLDELIQCSVINRTTATPPGSPADGDAYIVAGSPTGAWVGHTGKIARWSSVASAWEFYTPKAGWRAHVVAENATLTYVSSTWQQREANMLTAVNTQTGTTYTFALTDALSTVVRQSNAGAITDTLPTNAAVAFPIGSVLLVRQTGAGQVTVTPTGGVTLNIPSGRAAKTRAQGSSLMMHKVGTDEWDLSGDLATV